MFSKNAKCHLISTVRIKTVQRKQNQDCAEETVMDGCCNSQTVNCECLTILAAYHSVSMKVVRFHNALEYMFVA